MDRRAVEPLMTLSDVAALAGVRRPVVTMWRRRPVVAGDSVPFPEPVTVAHGVECFAVDDVLSWLERTGRGNNLEARADAYAHVELPGIAGRVAALDAAAALLCLKARTGATLAGTPAEEIVDLADEEDPDDACLFREIEVLGDDLPRMASYVDRLTDAAYSVGGALKRLESLRRPNSATAKVTLTETGLRLVGAQGAALALDLSAAGVTIVDPTGGSGDLVEAVMDRLGEGIDATVCVTGDTPGARWARRTHLIRGWDAARSAPSDAAVLVVAKFPNEVRLAMGRRDILDAIDGIQLELPEQHRALVLGPSAALCDDLHDPALEAERDRVLRLGRLRLAARLPKGLLVGSSRQALGLWVLGADAPGVRLEERWVSTADLSDEELTADVVDDLATDVVSSVGDRRLGAAHAFRFARMARTATILAGRGPLVPDGVRPATPRVVQPAQDVVALRSLAQEAGLEARLHVTPGERAGSMPVVSLAEAMAEGAVRVLAGVRLHREGLGAGTLRVLGPDDVMSDAAPSRTGVDPIELEHRHPRARRTEPDDVVFVTTPQPRAVVDRAGLSVVAYPARVLRCAPGSGVVPEAVARAINSLPDGARQWRTWAVPRVPPQDADTLGEVLRVVADERHAALRRVDALERLAGRVVDVVATGAATVSLQIAESHQKCDDRQYREEG